MDLICNQSVDEIKKRRLLRIEEKVKLAEIRTQRVGIGFLRVARGLTMIVRYAPRGLLAILSELSGVFLDRNFYSIQDFADFMLEDAERTAFIFKKWQALIE